MCAFISDFKYVSFIHVSSYIIKAIFFIKTLKFIFKLRVQSFKNNGQQTSTFTSTRSFEKQIWPDSLNIFLWTNCRCYRLRIWWCITLLNGSINRSVLVTYLPWKIKDLSNTNNLCRSIFKNKLKNGEMFVWAHPFDLHFKVNELSGWPKIILKIWRFN